MPKSTQLASQFLILLCAVAALWAIPTTAHAYIDPGAGSLILQVLLGGIAGVLVLLKTYWRRFTGGGESGNQSEDPPTHKDNSPS
ncbi:MAG TPA: hypothetical protein DDZ83_11425 [Nitrospinae bacterium]|nr:hypothetical protein [Nitrospinota bacterium]